MTSNYYGDGLNGVVVNLGGCWSNMGGCYCNWLLEQLSPEQDHLSVRAHWHFVSLFHFTPRLLVTGNLCGVFVLVACFLGCVFVVWFAFPGGIVDVFLNLASLDMTATVLSNAASGKTKAWISTSTMISDVLTKPMRADLLLKILHRNAYEIVASEVISTMEARSFTCLGPRDRNVTCTTG